MAKIKGVGLVSLLKIAHKQGADFEEKFLASLDPEEKENFRNVLPISWRPLIVEENRSGLCLLGKMLFPGDSNAYYKLGSLVCQESISRFFKIFIRIPKPQFIVTKAATIWKSYYDSGELETIENGSNSFTIILKQFPEFPVFLRDFLCGYLVELYAMIGIKTAKVTKIETDPNAWKWEIVW